MDEEKSYVSRDFTLLSKKQRRELIETMKRRGYKFAAVQRGMFVFESEIPNGHSRFGFLK